MGYNWQTGQIVLGIETDFQGADIRGSTTVGGPFGFAGPPPGVALPAGIFTASEKIDWFGTVRGRVGWVPWDRVPIFATGGLIYGHVVADSLFTARMWVPLTLAALPPLERAGRSAAELNTPSPIIGAEK